jgi:phytoene dehydrogenase-like protein
VRVIEAADEIGGGTRTAELTCRASCTTSARRPSDGHPVALLPQLPLAEHGLEWVRPGSSVAHPLDDGRPR